MSIQEANGFFGNACWKCYEVLMILKTVQSAFYAMGGTVNAQGQAENLGVVTGALMAQGMDKATAHSKLLGKWQELLFSYRVLLIKRKTSDFTLDIDSKKKRFISFLETRTYSRTSYLSMDRK